MEEKIEKPIVKKTKRTEADKKNLIKRLNIVEGQIGGMRKMIENDAYCVDILIQSSAVKAGIDSFNRDMLSNHIKNCVLKDIKQGNDEVIDELLSLVIKLIK